jgi:hypothetical protein
MLSGDQSNQPRGRFRCLDGHVPDGLLGIVVPGVRTGDFTY